MAEGLTRNRSLLFKTNLKKGIDNGDVKFLKWVYWYQKIIVTEVIYIEIACPVVRIIDRINICNNNSWVISTGIES